MKTANIQEIFCSLQGEGPYTGKEMIFIRFTGCNLRCSYCDTKKAFKSANFCLYENVPFSKKQQKIKNNLNVHETVNLIKNIKTKTKYISFTGGEPLLQAKFIKEVIQHLDKKYKYLLETNGTLINNLKILKNYINIFSIDIKKGSENKNINFCNLLKNKKNKYLKVVLEKNIVPTLLAKTIKQTGFKEVFLQLEYNNILPKTRLINLINTLEKNKINFKFSGQLHKILKLK